jgi:hypothetical protein
MFMRKLVFAMSNKALYFERRNKDMPFLFRICILRANKTVV